MVSSKKTTKKTVKKAAPKEIKPPSKAELEKQINAAIIGKKCIIRSREQGVMYGTVLAVDGRSCVVEKARQLWQWDCKFVLIELAAYGVRNASANRFSRESIEPVLMSEFCGIIPCSPEAIKSLDSIPPQER